jgi:hypothetical protein
VHRSPRGGGARHRASRGSERPRSDSSRGPDHPRRPDAGGTRRGERVRLPDLAPRCDGGAARRASGSRAPPAAVTTLPVVVGFGIGTPSQAAAAARSADGVVVGSALVEALEAGGLPAAERLLAGLVGALRIRGAA